MINIILFEELEESIVNRIKEHVQIVSINKIVNIIPKLNKYTIVYTYHHNSVGVFSFNKCVLDDIISESIKIRRDKLLNDYE